jgi:hypothetical protein
MRGHLLFGMMIAHLNFHSVYVFEYLHPYFYIGLYDAEFFVLISGWLVGVLTSKRSDGRFGLARFCLKRMRLIYLYLILCNLPFFALELWRGEAIASLPVRIISSLALLDGSLLSGVLYIYLFCFAYLLILGTVFSNRFLMASASGALYTFGLIHGQTGAFGYGEDITYFNLQTWQLVFLAGFILGERRVVIADFVQRLGSRAVKFVTTLSIVVVMGSYLHGWYPGIGLMPGQSDILDARHQLHPIYLLRLVAFGALVCVHIGARAARDGLIARSIKAYFNLPFLQRMGAVSIQAFTFHVFLIFTFKLFAASVENNVRTIAGFGFLFLFAAFPYLRSMFFDVFSRPAPEKN